MSAQALCHRSAVQRRAATSADLPLLRSLFADSRMELVALSPDSRFVLVDMQFRAQRHQLRTQFPHAEHDILVVDGVDVGRVVVDRSEPDVRVVDITVALGHRRQGIATAVLAEIAAEAKASGRDARVALWSGNSAAHAASARDGFAAASDEAGDLGRELAVTSAG